MNGASNFSRKLILPLTVLAFFLAGLAIAPFALSKQQQSRLPSWLQAAFNQVQGYRFWLLRLDREGLVAARMKVLSDDVTAALRKLDVADFEVSLAEPGVLQIALADDLDMKLARQALELVKTREFDVQTTPEGEIYLTYASDAIDRASQNAISRFVQTGGLWGDALDEELKERLVIKQTGTDDVSIELPNSSAHREVDIQTVLETLPQFSVNWVREVPELGQKLEAEEAEAETDEQAGGIKDLLSEADAGQGGQGDEPVIPVPEGTFLAQGLWDDGEKYLLEVPALVTGEDLEMASYVDNNGGAAIQIELNPRGALQLAIAEKDNQHNKLALVLNDEVIAAIAAGSDYHNGKFIVQLGVPSQGITPLANALNRSVPPANWNLVDEGKNNWGLIILLVILAIVVIVLICIAIFFRTKPVVRRE